ncbi:DKNYY domain-containing protein [Rhizobacter sp. Root1221]|uniref:DKNYY domain-containing protein n=1 Tax=Rhizobacter sp. Root1221 TaxID=1736433 RepID=UPI0006FE57E2|nr:DKNYY domain-containing protein [Rhizobacter sp. Root1221]KQV78259.1 hypothetical protein ASC87_11700 [Rhizobacter sp. Root1221]
MIFRFASLARLALALRGFALLAPPFATLLMREMKNKAPLFVLAGLVALLIGGALIFTGGQPTPPSPTLESAHQIRWFPLKSNLYSTRDGELGFRVFAATGDQKGSTERYLTHFDFGGGARLVDVIDVSTFEQLGTSDFYRDKTHLYQYYDMADGGRLSLYTDVEPSVDRESFVVLNDFYAKDKGRIYYHRGGWIREADPGSFIAMGESALAKDRHRYFLFGEAALPEAVLGYLQEICGLTGNEPAVVAECRSQAVQPRKSTAR